MRKSTRANKLNELLGISAKVAEVAVKKTGKIVGITEEEIQEFREMQGLHYFLQAPALFTPKVCKHCGEGFLVSRKYVAFCSYTCIRKELSEQGIEWTKGNDIEALVASVYDGNEPLWIRSSTLNVIKQMVMTFGNDSSSNTDQSLVSSALPASQQESVSLSSPPKITSNESSPPSSSTSSTTTSPSTIGTSSLPKKKAKRRIISST